MQCNDRFQAISRYEPVLAGKITGMVLEMADTELLKMLENEAMRLSKVYRELCSDVRVWTVG